MHHFRLHTDTVYADANFIFLIPLNPAPLNYYNSRHTDNFTDNTILITF